MGKPNFVLIMADDMGYGDFGVFSEGRVRTPFLDSLIDESVCLSQNYTGSPVCSPSRAAMLTGRYPIRTGAVTPQETLGIRPHRPPRDHPRRYLQSQRLRYRPHRQVAQRRARSALPPERSRFR